MQIKMWVGASVLLTSMVALSACTGSVNGSGTQTEDTVESSQLVAKKKQWLEGYDRYCAGCFQAFEECEKQAAESAESVDCKAQLDACMRDGLIKDGDRADDADANGEEDVADDPDVEVDDDADADANADEGDAGADDDAADVDDDADVDDAGDDADDPRADDGAADDDAEAAQDAIKAQLIEDVGVCLEEVGTCLQAQSDDPRPCLREVKTCVRDALTVAFNAVCGDEIALAEEDSASEERVRGLQRQCAEQLVTTLLD